jgi:hypothetical protein
MLTNIFFFIIPVWLWRLVTKGSVSFTQALWIVGRSPNHYSSLLGDLTSKINHEAKVYAAGWRSLDIFYNYKEKIEVNLGNRLADKFTRLWIGKSENRQSVANRKKIVTKLLINSFRKFINAPEVRLISLASGSAQAVIDAIKKTPGCKIRVKLIDNDPTAIEESKRVVKEAGLEDSFEFIKGTTKEFENACKDFEPHIIEMVGFLDYRTDDKAVCLFRRIRSNLSPRGLFLTCNISKNREKILLDWILLWPMIYRTPEKLLEILKKGGFEEKKIELYSCPFEIHTIALCQK